MADRFPSLDDTDAGQTEAREPVSDGVTQANDDSTSDFLARERAALGDDANLFSTQGETNQTSAVDGTSDDLLGESDSALVNGNTAQQSSESQQDMNDFESSFPSINTQNEAVGPGGSITNTSSLPYNTPSHAEESEPIRAWRERRDLAIQHRDQVSAEKRAETIKAAQKDIDEFYEQYNNKREKTVAQTRREAEEFFKNREDTTSGGTSWERIAKLVDLSGKGSGGGGEGSNKAKFREILLSLRKDEKAPGATGY